MAELERIYTIPLRDVKAGSRNKATNRAVRAVRTYLAKHMKSEDIWLDAAVNEALWANGMYKIPSKIRVRAIKFDDGVVEVSLPESEQSSSIREQLREERESKTPILPSPEAEEDEIEGEDDGAAEIDAEPEGDGEAEIEAEPEGEGEDVSRGGAEANIEAEEEGDGEATIEAESEKPDAAADAKPEAKQPAADEGDQSGSEESKKESSD